jgi:prepilin-type processing-associated H-X9-DG protein
MRPSVKRFEEFMWVSFKFYNSMETRNERWFLSGTWEDIIGFRHGGHANVLYADLSVGVVTPDEISEKNIDPEWE